MLCYLILCPPDSYLSLPLCRHLLPLAFAFIAFDAEGCTRRDGSSASRGCGAGAADAHHVPTPAGKAGWQVCCRTHACESRQARSRWMWGCWVPRACSFAKKTCASEVAIASVVLARREHDRAAYMQTYPERGGCFPTHARVGQRDEVRAHARPRARLPKRRRPRRAAAAHSALRDGCFATHRPHAHLSPTSRLPLAHLSPRLWAADRHLQTPEIVSVSRFIATINVR